MNMALYRYIAGVVCLFLSLIPSVHAQSMAPINLDFDVNDALFDAPRGLVYLSSGTEKKVFIANVYDGRIVQEFVFERTPVSLTMNPDGSRLYLALAATTGATDDGLLVEFDPETQAKLGEFPIVSDPTDILATTDGVLYVTRTRNSWTTLKSYSLETGSEIDESIRTRVSVLRLHPDEDRIYGAKTGSGLEQFERLSIDEGFFTEAWQIQEQQDEPGINLFLDPEGMEMLSVGGDLYSTAPDQENDLIYQQSLNLSPIESAVFDTVNTTLFTLVNTSIHYFNRQSKIKMGQIDLGQEGQFIDLIGDTLYAITTHEEDSAQLEKFLHPTLGLSDNNPALAQFSVSPGIEGTTQDEYVFDASLSTDDTTPTEELLVRWDLDGDGVFDTEFESTLSISHRFFFPGTYPVTLEVQDASGYVSTVTQTISISFAPDPGQAPDSLNTPNAFGFRFTDVAYDRTRPLAYVSSRDNNQFYVINLLTGLIDKVFDLPLMPGSITITPDGSTLYLALLTRNHDSNWRDEDGHEGYIATFELDAITKTNQYWINEDPFDLVATDDGHIYVTSGSGGFTFMRSYRAEDGVEVSNYEGIDDRTRIVLHPSQNRIYGARSLQFSREMERWTIENGVIGDYWPIQGNSLRVSYSLFMSPLGNRLITRGGGIYSLAANQEDDMVFVDHITENFDVNSVAFDEAHSAIFIPFANQVHYYNLENYAYVGQAELDHSAFSPGVYGDSVYVFTFDGENTRYLNRLLNPMLGAESNTAPTAAFAITPEGALPGVDLSFDATESSDTETPSEELLVRWDWERRRRV